MVDAQDCIGFSQPGVQRGAQARKRGDGEHRENEPRRDRVRRAREHEREHDEHGSARYQGAADDEQRTLQGEAIHAPAHIGGLRLDP